MIRKQPPVRIQYCEVPAQVPASDACGGGVCPEPTELCPRCLFPHCARHMVSHIQGLSVPPDSWKTLRRRIWARAKQVAPDATFNGSLFVKGPNRRLTETRLGDVLVDKRPPVRIEACAPPSSGFVNKPCVHQNAACKGAPVKCDRCHFTHCAKHAAAHIKNLALPRRIWRRIETSYVRQLDATVVRPRLAVKVYSPSFVAVR